jgi:ubiquinone/menaquinone biosynthesis C-methylase UbiE
VRIERTPSGVVIHSALEYDLRWLVRSRGRERAFRRHLLDLGRVRAGEAVLDVGCATGSLALAAKRRVGADGVVHGVDPSPRMIARARAKARRRRAAVAFGVAVAQELPFADASFDVVVCTLVAHELPHADRRKCIAEMHRVLKARGRLLLVDLAMSGYAPSGPTPHRHGHFDVSDLVPLLTEEGFAVVARGAVPFALRRFDPLGYVLAAA